MTTGGEGDERRIIGGISGNRSIVMAGPVPAIPIGKAGVLPIEITGTRPVMTMAGEGVGHVSEQAPAMSPG